MKPAPNGRDVNMLPMMHSVHKGFEVAPYRRDIFRLLLTLFPAATWWRRLPRFASLIHRQCVSGLTISRTGLTCLPNSAPIRGISAFSFGRGTMRFWGSWRRRTSICALRNRTCAGWRGAKSWCREANEPLVGRIIPACDAGAGDGAGGISACAGSVLSCFTLPR